MYNQEYQEEYIEDRIIAYMRRLSLHVEFRGDDDYRINISQEIVKDILRDLYDEAKI